MSINTHYHDSESAAEAATELARQAVAAAQVASLLATRRDSTKEFFVSSDHSRNQKDSQYMDHHPGSRRQSRDSETSSYYAKPSAENRGIGRRHSYNNPGINESDYEEDYTRTQAEANETMRRRHSYNSPSIPPPPATSEIKFDESDYYEEETEPEEPPQARVSSLPPNRAPPQAPQSDESRRDSSGHHVHPKLPDYDMLAARFEAIRHSKGPLI